MKPFDAHLFVCTHQREVGESCGEKNSAELRDAVKKICQTKLADSGLRVRVNSSGCLGACSEGIAAVLYPQGEWHLSLKSSDGASLASDVLESVGDGA